MSAAMDQSQGRQDSGRISVDPVSALRLALLLLLLGVFSYSAYASFSFHPRAAYFPRAVGGIGVVVVLISLVLDIRAMRRVGTCVPPSSTEGTTTLGRARKGERWSAVRGVGKYLLVFVLYVALIRLFGIFPATAIFLVAFLKFETDFKWWQILLGAGALLTLMDQLGDAMNLRWPRSVFVIWQP